MIILKICFSMWIGLCGHIEKLPFQTMEECLKQQTYFRTVEQVDYAYCTLSEVKKNDQD